MFSNLGTHLVDGTADTLERASSVLSFVILAFPVVWLWMWRKFVVASGLAPRWAAQQPQ